MGVQADNGTVAALQVTAEIFNLVGVAVGGAALHRVGQVDDDLVFRRCAQLFQHPVADFHGVVHFGAGEALGGILIADVDAAAGHFLFRQLADEPCALDGDIDDTLHVGVENHFPLKGRSGVIEVNDHVLCPADGFKGFLNQVRTSLYQHLNGHVIGNQIALDEGAEDFILGFGSGGEAHFNLLKADIHQRFEKQQLFFQIHRGNQCLVPVPQIHAAPDRSLGDDLVRPLAVLQLYRLKRNVLFTTLIHKTISQYK